MNALSLKEHDIAKTITDQYDYIRKIDAIKYCKSIFGKTASLAQIVRAYNSIEWYSIEL